MSLLILHFVSSAIALPTLWGHIVRRCLLLCSTLYPCSVKNENTQLIWSSGGVYEVYEKNVQCNIPNNIELRAMSDAVQCETKV
jgi:hypothetical protein